MYNPIYILVASLRALILIISLLIIIPIYIISTKLGFENTPRRAFKIRRAWVSFARLVLGIKCEVRGTASDSTALYVCNHRSFSDPLVLAGYVDAHVIAKAEVSNLPLIGTGAEMTGVIYVKRDSQNSRSAVRERMVEVLLEGKNVIVYPEGTTNGNLQVKPFKKGTFVEAAKNSIPVVPVVLEYKRKKDLWFNKGMFTHHFKQFGRLTTRCIMEIGTPMKNVDGLALAEEVERWTNDKILEIHSTWDSDFHKELKTTEP